MTIHPVSRDGAPGAPDPKRVEPREAPTRAEPVSPASPAPPADTVEISGEGRVLAGLAEQADALGLDAGTLRTIQNRLAGGFYQRPEVVETVAQRLLNSGDLGVDASGER